ncbi:MAG TPA: AsmA-like C-terminal region-containing protein [Burkholderiales bacterium]|nr:AsmA-like C-terminal region-containing protein [Burkholderiales bacterium]
MPDTPTDRPRWRRRLAIAVAVVVLLLGAAVAALPLLIDSNAVRRVVEREISALAGGDVRYDSLAVHLFPQPRAAIRGVSVRVPGLVDGRAAELDVSLSLLPLLAGNVRPTAIRIEQPAFEVRIEPGGGGAGDPFAVYRESVGPVVDALARDARGMTIEIVGGTLDVAYAGRRLVSLSDLAAQADVSAEAIDASVSSAADLWRAAQGRLTISPGSLAASAKLQVTGLQAGGMLDAMQSESAFVLRPGPLDASVDAQTDGHSTVRATLTTAAPQITLARGARTLDLGAVRLAAEVGHDGQALALTLRGLQLGNLLPQATGSFRVQPDGAAPALELQIPAVDLARLRAAALTLADDLDAVRTAAAIVTAGTARALTVSAAGSDFAALADVRAFRAEAQLEAAGVAVPAARIAVTKGAGRLAFAEGALRASELTGETGKSRFNAGGLVLEFLPAVSLRSLDAAVDADLAEVLAITRHVLGRAGEAALADIESLQGRASGRFAYEARRSGPHFAVEVAKLAATGRYRGVPFPLEVSQGEVSYAGDRLRVRRLAGSVGGSHLQAGGEAELVFGAEPAVRSARAAFSLVLDELYPWLASLERLQPALKDLKSVTGTATVQLMRLSGPFADPAALDFEAVVQPQQLRASLTELPAPLTLAGGEANVTPRALRLNGLQALLLDARVTASGTVQDYASSDRRIDLALANGSAGQQALDWVRARWQVPPKAMPRAPLSLAGGRLQWPADAPGSLAAQGTVGLAEKVDAEFDLTWRPGDLDLRRLSLKDADSDATIALKWAAARADLAFRGTLDNRTVERLLAPPPEVQGSLRGDFRASIDLRAPRRSTATGSLEGEGLDVFERWDLPVLIDRVRVEVAGDAVRIRDTVLRVAGERLAVSGSVERKPETFAIDAQVSAERVDVARLVGGFRGDRRPTGAAWDLPVEGRVAIAAKAVVYDERVFQPVVATVSLAPNRVVAEVTDARHCGVALTLKADLAPRSAALTGRGHARDQGVEQATECLTRENHALTGRFDLDLELAASGAHEALLRTARGRLRFVARDGRIQRAPAITRILFLNNVAALLRTGPKELMAGGLEYREVATTWTLEGTRVRVESATFDSPSLGMAGSGEVELTTRTLAIHGLVAPFANINAVARSIPILGPIFNTRLVGIPVSVTGDWRDPIVVPLGPEAVGQSLVNLMGATFKAPIDLLDPFLGTRRSSEPRP